MNEPQLFDLSNDISEQHNLASERKEVLAKLEAKLEDIKKDK